MNNHHIGKSQSPDLKIYICFSFLISKTAKKFMIKINPENLSISAATLINRLYMYITVDLLS